MDEELMLNMYRKMLEIRFFELTIADLFKKAKIKGVVHLSIGQEATAVGACFALKKDDYITGNHRSHGHNLAKGADINRVMAEIMGKVTGYNHGRGGSMNVTAGEVGNLWSSAIVGSNLPLAVGSALTSKMKNTGRVTLCFFGEGASNTGNFHESLNLASIWKLPVIFLCENNIYAVSTPVWYSSSAQLTKRAVSYSIPGICVDGNDVLAVYEAVCEASKRARQGEGPSLIECKTYRWEGHYVGDPRVYRTRNEENEWRKKDPIKQFKSKLLNTRKFSEEKLKIVEEESRRKVEKAVEFAIESPEPLADKVMDYLYAWKEG